MRWYHEAIKVTYWRSYTGFKLPLGATAGDLVRYEQEMLGNDLGVGRVTLERLDSFPANRIVWITKHKRDAEKYGDPQMIEINFLEEIAKDGEGGYLILSSCAPIEI